VRPDQLIVALDVEDFSQVKKIVSQLSPPVCFYKVGLRLFTREGPAVVEWLKQQNCKIFLDLKLHDIPNTVAQAVESAAALEVDFLTLHALGGLEMMRAAAQVKKRPKLFAVTVLTSHDDLKPLGISDPIPQEVDRLAGLAQQAGVEGLVCSPHEVKNLKQKWKSTFEFITPGIRLDSETKKDYSEHSEREGVGATRAPVKDDQKRVATPEQALSDGSDYLVIGRPVLQAPDPRSVAQKILAAQ